MKKMKLLSIFMLFLILSSITTSCDDKCRIEDLDVNFVFFYEDKNGNNMFERANGFHEDSIDTYTLENGLVTKIFDSEKGWQERFYVNRSKPNGDGIAMTFAASGPVVNLKSTNYIEFTNRKDIDTLVFTWNECHTVAEKLEYNGKVIWSGNTTAGLTKRFTIQKNY
jgi:hypothetical protein